MGSLFEYLDWRGDLSFKEAGLNMVDSLILSEFSYIDYSDILPEGERISLSRAAERYSELYPKKKKLLGFIPDEEIQDLFIKAGNTLRFGEVEIWGFVNEIDKAQESQFSACCFSLGSGCTYVAYRGTDNSIAGWKENLNMAYLFPVPAQLKAAEYLEKAAERTKDTLQLGGHSKGGNLACYAGIYAPEEIKKRIEHIWSNDGPGFMQAVLDSEEYKSVKDRITVILPSSSVVGVLLESDCEHIIIESSAHGPKQHDGLSWQLMGGSFTRAEETSSGSRQVDETAEALVNKLSIEQKREVIDAVFDAIYSTGADTLTELLSGREGIKNLNSVLSSLDMEPETREQFIKTIMESFHVDERIVNLIFSRGQKETADINS